MNSEEKTVSIKWNGKSIENVLSTEGQHVSALKRAIEENCGLPSKKQKLLFKGKFLKVFKNINFLSKSIKDTDIIEKEMFDSGKTIMLMGTLEPADVSSHLAKAQAVEYSVPDDEQKLVLQTGLKNLGNTCYVNSTLQVLAGLNKLFHMFEGDNINQSDPLVVSFLQLLKSLNGNAASLTPIDFILKLRLKFPQYSEKNNYGQYIQHDVHEFWSSFISFIGSNISLPQNFSILLEKKIENESSSSYENVGCLLLPVTADTGSLEDSLKKSLLETAPESANVSSRSFFSNLPFCLPFVFMRFMWKTNEKVQAKILKFISYPKVFDIFYYASETLKAEITAQRETIPEYGKYNLQFIISHTGRDADSGHYMAWSKIAREKVDEWIKFDDDKISTIQEEEIMKLGGGGDRPIAYMIVYVQSWKDVRTC